MPLKERIQQDVKEALKAGDASRVEVLRSLVSVISNKEIASGEREVGLSEEIIFGVLKSEAKKRAEARDLFLKGNREELADKEAKELEIIKTYLPEEMDTGEVQKIVDREIELLRESGNDISFGDAMKAVMKQLQGKADAKKVSEMVREKIGGK